MEKEERKLREEDPQLFERDVGHFWGIHETRPYMRSRAALIDELCTTNIREGVQSALDLALGNLKLCRGDNMGTRSLIPALMIRLGKDQEAYDFIKWYETSGNDMSLPYLNLHDEDVFENPEAALGDRKFGDLANQSCLALIKFRLLSDLQSLQNSMALG
ncbi:hypothetical protein M409DRAFT_27977 [Zasmidium cellare ATCC 36951]|uniref:Uncharacterized protein n=1 Tax=Zasmidium cellare ATCC 36951 TaxID=1080233 RepID=A0A6A6C6S1_ZASCE|nr:uncharacterized protein M409DRAFT_27977 [Zasmidium cellare ATCC 36951]KAF2161582.1 hypothetical protein M409DRAFT_27977 [Zasmidium cellare ATCC 36951]